MVKQVGKGLKGEPGPAMHLRSLSGKDEFPLKPTLPPAVPGTNGWTRIKPIDTKYFYVSNADGTYTLKFENLECLIKGDSGDDGATAYELALDNGFSGTEAEWLESLKGEQGPDEEKECLRRLLRTMVSQEQKQSGLSLLKPNDGEDGDSAYEVAVEDGFVGTETEWLESLKGEPG